MKFESWLKKQKDRDDQIGDLAKDYIQTRLNSIKESFNKFHPCDAAIESYKLAVDEYLEFMKNELDIFKDDSNEEI